MVRFPPERVVLTEPRSIEVFWLFVRAGRKSFSEFIEAFGQEEIERFLSALDEAGLEVRQKERRVR